MLEWLVWRLFWLWNRRPVLVSKHRLARLEGDSNFALKRAQRALEFLEHNGEDGIHSARSCLYDVLYILAK